MMENALMNHPIKAVNIGLELLCKGLRDQEVDTVSIAWRPPKEVHLSPRIREILNKIDDD